MSSEREAPSLLNDALAALLDRSGLGVILLRRQDPAVLYLGRTAKELLGIGRNGVLGIPDLLASISWSRETDLVNEAESSNHPINKALAGEEAAKTPCRIRSIGTNSEQKIRLSYGPADGPDGPGTTAFLLLERIGGGGPPREVIGGDEFIEIEQRLREQLKRFYIPTFVWQLVDGEFVLIEVNDAALAVTNGEAADNLGLPASQIYRERPDIRADIFACFETKARITREITDRTFGEDKDRDWTKTYVYVPPDLVMVHAEEITERKLADRLAHDRESRLRMLVEQVPAVLWSTDKDLRITSSTGSALTAMNEIPNQSVGMGLIALLSSSADSPRVLAAHEHALRGQSATYEITFNGREFRSHIEPLYGPEGSVVGTIGLGLDVTDSKKAETNLRQSEERYRAFVEQSSEGIWRLEVNPPIPTELPIDTQVEMMMDRCYVAECNDAMAQMYGCSRASELVGRTWRGIHVEGDSLNLDGLRRFVSAGYKSSESESHDLTDTGEAKYFSNNAVGIVENGALVRVWGTQRDITQGRLAEQALRASESRFSLAFNSAPVVIAISKVADGKCIDVNETFLRLTGFSRDEVIGRTGLDLGLWTLPDEVRRIREALEHTKSVRNVEVTQRMKSGELRHFVLSADVIEIAGEDCILAVGVDITDRKVAEAERASLLASEKAARREAEQANLYRAELLVREQSARAQAEAAWLEWQQTFDAMAEEVSLVDTEGRLLRANRAFYAWWGKTPEECVGKPLHEVAHRNPDEAAGCAICELRSRGERAAIEFPPGSVSERPLYVAIDPILDSSGATVGFVQQIKDLSALYQARALAERERTSLNAIIDQMAEGLIVCDENGVVTRANGLAQECFGLSLTEMINDKTNDLARRRFTDLQGLVVPIEDLPVQRALSERRVIDGARLWYTKPNGDRILLSIVSSPFLNEQGDLRGAVALIRDVTEQQREHDRLQQVDKMRALGQLSSGVAHNFNNSLASILGYTHLALRKAEGSELEKYLGIIQKSAQDAARMVERIQNFSRSHPRSGDFRPVRLADIVKDAVEIGRPRWRNDAESLGIKYDVIVEWDADDDLVVDGEQSELREVFLNIILNALDAMPSGGSLIVSAIGDSQTVAVSFSDTGTGMTPEIKLRVFEPFFTTKGVAGLGLGLSESYRIIERHGGRIEIESRLHHGTTFTVILPVSRSTVEPMPEREESELITPALKILVLDDEVFVRGALSAMLTEMGHTTVEASSAREAVELAKQQPFDLVFTDLAMPEIDGIAAAAMLKSVNADLKLILMSGYGSDKASDRARYSQSVDAVIAKPFSFSEIRQIVLDIFPS